MKPLNECLYYLVREWGGAGPEADDTYFEDALKQIDKEHFMRGIEFDALVKAAERRGRLGELEKIYEEVKGREDGKPTTR